MKSRDGRVTALTVYGVLAPDELRFEESELRVVPRKEMPFVPNCGMMGFFYCADSVG